MCPWTKNGGEKTRMPMVIPTATSTIVRVFSAATKFLQKHDTNNFYRKIHRNEQRFIEFQRKPGHRWNILTERWINTQGFQALSWIVDHARLMELSADFRPDLPDLRLPWARLLATFIHWSEVKQCICWPWMELSHYLSLSWLIAKKRITPMPIYTPYKPQKDRRHMVLPVLYFFSAPRSIVSSAWSHYQVGHGWCLTFFRIRWATSAVL